ncbi:MAG: DUF2950 family protein [Planctomycetota bacterium]|jgi:hypothetical protein
MSEQQSPVRTVVIITVTLVVIGGVAMLLLPSHAHPSWTRNEPAVVGALRTYLMAQNIFHKNIYYGEDTGLVYANPKDGKGFVDLHSLSGPATGGEPLKLVDKPFADATSPATPKSGYWFVDITAGPQGPFDNEVECGLCAVPAEHGKSGFKTFIVDVSGRIYGKDNGGRPVTVWPDVEKEGWQPVD